MARSASLVIVTLDRADSLDRTLTSLRQLRYPDFEVLVVAGPSRDHTAEVIARHAGACRVYHAAERNISAARNIGLAHAQGEIVAFLDDDAVPEPDWLDALLAPYSDRRVAAVGGFIRDADGFGFQARYTVSNRYGDVTPFDVAPLLDGESFLCLTGTNFSARRETLIALGGFDEAYVWFLDETDVNLRMHDLGLKAKVAEDAEIHHKYEAGVTRGGSAPRTMYPQLRSKAYFGVTHNLGRRPLAEILRYLAGYVAQERIWKSELAGAGVAAETVARLIGEVERGARDGVAEALRVTGPQGLSPARLAGAAGDAFKPFPIRRPEGGRLRLCLLSREYPPQGHGGIGQWTREVAVGLAARGHEVTVIARALEGGPRIDFVEGVWVHRIGAGGVSEAEAGEFAPAPGALASASLELWREIERIGPRRRFDLISGPIADLEPMAALRFAAVPVVVSLHTTYRLSLPHKPDWLSRPDYLAAHVEPAIACENELLTQSPHLLANSHAVVADIEAAHGVTLDRARVAVAPHGIADLAAETARAEREPGVHLLFVGRLEARKGADLLLGALPGLLEAHPELIAHIVGDDGLPFGESTLRLAYEARTAPEALARTRFYGALPRADVLARYAACDLFVAPSRYESFGLVFVEAMGFGKPSVAFSVGGAAEIITDGVEGLLAPDGDAAALAAAISRLVEDRALRERLGRNARAAYEARFTTAHMLDRLEAYYRGVAGSPSAAAKAS